MKHLRFHLIIFYFCFAFINTGCEKAEIQSTTIQADSTKPITNRDIDECEDCPQEYCCCGIELLSTPLVSLTICGVYTAMPAIVCPQPLNQPMGCTGTIASHNSAFMLSGLNPRALFCLPVGNMLRIFNHGPNQAIFRFTCQVEDFDPDYESITLDPGEAAWFQSDGSCFLEGCG